MSLYTLNDITPLVLYNSPLGFLALLYFKFNKYILLVISHKNILRRSLSLKTDIEKTSILIKYPKPELYASIHNLKKGLNYMNS